MAETNKMLAILDNYLPDNPDEIAKEIAAEFRHRRMVFNYIAENKDDHCKNFSFIVNKDNENKWQWHLAPHTTLLIAQRDIMANTLHR